ncbi:DUF4381 domain-containing protein [Tunturiibacter gelidoferens]|jgi:Domain of unknown function (DUF4381)|uniref:DUF4381 domain-containing protein n=1 Tax=Tunturiibacter gelidiferens TaxID=3069689 RepID=A0A9X0QA81_9BACT|nr:DUF4381 domain-containing protein [Edaphobacter lichenicola]MBB5326550.1 hypothetical protein [Edaphobacter lichenicola]
MSAPLDKLHDFYQPPGPTWTPQTVGWYVLFVIAGLLVIWVSVHQMRKWFANRYRRAALRELDLLPANEFSALLKRTALAVWPRERVASLSGAEWLNFLNEATGDETFHSPPADRIEEMALQPVTLSNEDEHTLRRTVATWIRSHRV